MYFLLILLLQCFILDLGRTFWRTIYFFRVALPELRAAAQVLISLPVRYQVRFRGRLRERAKSYPKD
jgi:hypothetical protein